MTTKTKGRKGWSRATQMSCVGRNDAVIDLLADKGKGATFVVISCDVCGKHFAADEPVHQVGFLPDGASWGIRSLVCGACDLKLDTDEGARARAAQIAFNRFLAAAEGRGDHDGH